MSALAERVEITRDELVDRARTWSTAELETLYRTGRDMDDAHAEFTGWSDTTVAVARVLRERIVADWLHAGWCWVQCCCTPDEHMADVADAAANVVDVFEFGGDLASAVYRGMWPHNPPTARGTAELSRNPAFQRLIADLVSVVPAEDHVKALLNGQPVDGEQ